MSDFEPQNIGVRTDGFDDFWARFADEFKRVEPDAESTAMLRENIKTLYDVMTREPELAKGCIDELLHVLRERMLTEGSMTSQPIQMSREPAMTRERTAASDGLPRIWSILACAMSPKLRDNVYSPAIEELKEDYLLSLMNDNTPLERRALGWIFFVRGVLTYCQCLWAGLGETVRRLLRWMGVMTLLEIFHRLL